jgi:uncharacterized protein
VFVRRPYLGQAVTAGKEFRVGATPEEAHIRDTSGRVAMVTLETLRERRRDILAIASRHGASNVRIFGSVARGESRPDSDVDFLVDFEDGVSLMDHAGLMVDLEEFLQCKVDVGAARALKPRVRDRVLTDALPL